MKNGHGPLYLLQLLGYKISQLITLVIIRLFSFKVIVSGLENIPKDEIFILASNHIGHLDPYILVLIFPQRLYFLANPAKPLLNFIAGLDILGNITATGALALIRAAKKNAKNEIVAFFPEGARNAAGYPLKVKPGAAFLALKTRTRVLPVKIRGTDQALNYRTGKIKPGSEIYVSIGKLIALEEVYYSKPLWISAKEAIEVIMQQINLLG